MEPGKQAEKDWARLWVALGVPFEYEPHLFELGPNRGFKPDFWFPHADAYVEVTVTRHINRKNRKVVLAREQFPEKTFLLLTRHEHRIVFGPSSDVRLDWQRMDAWTQAAERLEALCALVDMNGWAERLTPLAA